MFRNAFTIIDGVSWCLLLRLSIAVVMTLPASTSVLAETERAGYSQLIIHTARKNVTFQVELVDTPQSRQQGLMFRDALADDEGMLFDYHSSRMVAMWMKNTLIPLDMLFISDTGEILTIETHTVPHSLQAISSKTPVRAVLELKAGSVDLFEILIGNTVTHEIFQNQRDGS